MALYALGDLHLSFGCPERPANLKKGVWRDHEERIRNNWISTVSEDDTIVLTGDFSHGKTEEQLRPDIDFLLALPGRKIMLRGNHDMFWDAKKTSKLNEKYTGSLFFLQDNHAVYESKSKKYALVGTKGYCFENLDSLEHCMKLEEREAARLRRSFDSAVSAGLGNFIMFLHYPPTSPIWPPTPELCRALGMSRKEEAVIRRDERALLSKRNGDNNGHNLVINLKKLPRELKNRASCVTQIDSSPFTEIAEEYGAETVIYSHAHGKDRFGDSLSGNVRGVRYQLVSGDYLDFRPYKIME